MLLSVSTSGGQSVGLQLERAAAHQVVNASS
jgi:hypothetical protein